MYTAEEGPGRFLKLLSLTARPECRTRGRGQSIPHLLRTAMLTLLRLPFLTPSCGANSRFPRAYARRYAESSDMLLCFLIVVGEGEALATF